MNKLFKKVLLVCLILVIAMPYQAFVSAQNINDAFGLQDEEGCGSGLSSISINGVPISGFLNEKYEYTFEVSDKTENLDIEYTKVNNNDTVTLTPPVDFPGKTIITVTDSNRKNIEYVINYTTDEKSEFIKNLQLLDNNLIPELYGGGEASVLPKFVKGGLMVDSQAYCDRMYVTTEVMDESLIGKDKIIGGIGWYNAVTPTANSFKSEDVLPWVNFELTRGATVMVFLTDREQTALPRFEQYGYALEKNTNGYFTNTLNTPNVAKHIYKFHRHYNAGEKVIVPNATQSNNTYTIVLSYDPIRHNSSVNHTALSKITVDGAELKDFDETVTDYTYILPLGQKDFPKVEAVASDPNAEVVITSPVTFPGKTTITVKCNGFEDNVYTINYSADTEVTMLESHNGTEIKWGGASARVKENLQAGDSCWIDRNNSAMKFKAVDESIAGKTYIPGALNWLNGGGNYYCDNVWKSADYIPDMYTITLKRSAVVRLFTNVPATEQYPKAREFAASGYTVEKFTDGGYATGYITSDFTYSYMYSKRIEVTGSPVGVDMPNLGGTPYFTVIDYDTYESLKGLTPADIPSTNLSAITVNGNEVEGFDATCTEYNVILTKKVVPVVCATPVYKNASVIVEQATEIPGSATVIVKAEGFSDSVYRINFDISYPDGYVGGMNISNRNVEMRRVKRTDWNQPLNSDMYTYTYSKTIDVPAGEIKSITLSIDGKPYQKGTIILRPTAEGLADKSVIVNSDGTPVKWIDDKSVARAYDYEKYPEYNPDGVTYGKKTGSKVVTLGSGASFEVFKEMFAADNRYVSGARTHYTRHPINAQVAMGSILPEWENCNYIVFNNYYGTDTKQESETVTFTVDKSVEVIFLTSANNVSVKESGVDTEKWAPVAVSGINRVYMNWVDSITVAYLIYNGYITEGDVVGTYAKIGGGDLGILIRNRSALEKFIDDWHAKFGERPIHGIQLKESDRVVTGFTNDTATYHHNVFLCCWEKLDIITALSVDGVPVSGFKPSILDYNIVIPDNQPDFPVISYTKADETVNVEVTNPTEFPGKTTITVNAPGEEAVTYTLNYVTSTNGALVTELKLSDKSKIDSTSAVWPITAGNLQEGDILSLGRYYKINKINDEVAKGKDRIMTAIGWNSDMNTDYSMAFRSELIPDWLSFRTKRGMNVIIYDDNVLDADKFTDLGFAHTANDDSYIYAQLNKISEDKYNEARYTQKYVKHFSAGKTVNIPNAFNGQTYLVVLEYDNYASLMDNFEGVQNIEMLESYNGEIVPWRNSVAKYRTNLSVGDLCYSDRSNDAMRWSYVAEDLNGKDWIQGALDWQNGGESLYSLMWKSEEIIPDYYSFELCKSAVVSIIATSNKQFEYFTDNGWVMESDTKNGYLVGYTASTVKYSYKFSKYFKVGNTPVRVSVPNIRNSVSAAVVVDYDALPAVNVNLKNLTLNGETAEGFASYKNTYNIPLVSGSVVPTVGYELFDTRASAVVVQATEIPGTATVTVTDPEGKNTAVYTIRFYEYIEKNISFDDLEARGVKTHTSAAVSVLYNTATNQMYTYEKTYTVPKGETKTINLTATELVNQFTGIVIVPEDDYAGNDVVVSKDGTALTWKEYTLNDGGSICAYDYNAGKEYSKNNATFTKYSTDGVSFAVNGEEQTAWMLEKMHYSDDIYVNGAPAVIDRDPSESGICWTEFPVDWEDCRYIAFPSNCFSANTTAEVAFTVNSSVKVILFTASASAKVKDDGDSENWSGTKVNMTRRYMHGVDSLSVAYMIKKGYMNESDISRTGISFAGYGGSENTGFYLRRYDCLIKMEEDIGANYGVGIKPERLDGTGFVNIGKEVVDYYIRDYTYQDFLDAWVDEEPPSQVETVNTKLSGIKVNGSTVPGFRSDVYTYQVQLPYGAGELRIEAVPVDSRAEIVVTQPASIPGVATILVTGKESKETSYTVNVFIGSKREIDVVNDRTLNLKGDLTEGIIYAALYEGDALKELKVYNPAREIPVSFKSRESGNTAVVMWWGRGLNPLCEPVILFAE